MLAVGEEGKERFQRLLKEEAGRLHDGVWRDLMCCSRLISLLQPTDLASLGRGVFQRRSTFSSFLPPFLPFFMVRSPGREHGNPLQYSCLDNTIGQSSLVGYSPWRCIELVMTEVIYHMSFKIRNIFSSMLAL